MVAGPWSEAVPPGGPSAGPGVAAVRPEVGRPEGPPRACPHREGLLLPGVRLSLLTGRGATSERACGRSGRLQLPPLTVPLPPWRRRPGPFHSWHRLSCLPLRGHPAAQTQPWGDLRLLLSPAYLGTPRRTRRRWPPQAPCSGVEGGRVGAKSETVHLTLGRKPSHNRGAWCQDPAKFRFSTPRGRKDSVRTKRRVRSGFIRSQGEAQCTACGPSRRASPAVPRGKVRFIGCVISYANEWPTEFCQENALVRADTLFQQYMR